MWEPRRWWKRGSVRVSARRRIYGDWFCEEKERILENNLISFKDSLRERAKRRIRKNYLDKIGGNVHEVEMLRVQGVRLHRRRFLHSMVNHCYRLSLGRPGSSNLTWEMWSNAKELLLSTS